MTQRDVLLEEIERSCDRGQFLEAWRQGATLGEFERWPGERGLLLASRITAHLGAPLRSDRLDLRLYRRAPRSVRALERVIYLALTRRGPLDAHTRLERALARGPLDDPQGLLGEIRAEVACAVRDFATATEALTAVASVAHEQEWFEGAWVRLLQAQDRYQEALERAQQASERHPHELRLPWQAAMLLLLLGREEEALQRLQELSATKQSFRLSMQAAALLIEKQRFREAQSVLERLEEIAPLAEAEVQQSIAAMRSEAAYALGERGTAIEQARRSTFPLLQRVADRLEAAPEGRRVCWPVPFVRQHHKTCAPATLTAISQFWQREARHLEIAEDICYDGTSDHSERRWATEHGWQAQEFLVTWEAATTLLERGIPFTLTTIEAQGGHLQAVIGFDEARRTFLVRDPTIPTLVEFDVDLLVERYRARGIRGMALVPVEQASRLVELSLPESSLFDRLHRLQTALSEHRREVAVEERDALAQVDPAHPLTFRARVAVGAYDRDPEAMLRATEQQLAHFPDDTIAQLHRLQCQQQLWARHDYLAALEALATPPSAHPLLRERLAGELLADPREHERAGRLLRACARTMPERGTPLAMLAELASQAGRPDEAAQLAWFASSLEDKNESLALGAMTRARLAGQPERGLERLRLRRTRLGARSTAPTLTYCEALLSLGRQQEALDELEAALREHPDEGELMLNAARWLKDIGQVERAADLIATAEPLVQRSTWLEPAAQVALRRGDAPLALARWRELLELVPLHEEAISGHAELLGALEGQDAVREFFARLMARFPRNRFLAALELEALGAGASPDLEAALLVQSEIHVADPRPRRTLAVLLAKQGRLAEAEQQLALATRLDDRSFEAHLASSEVLHALGQHERALDEVQQAVQEQPDDVRGFSLLARLLGGHGASTAVLRTLPSRLARCSLGGLGVSLWAHLASQFLPVEDVERDLRELLAARPDLQACWRATIECLVTQRKLTEASQLAGQACERFPFSPEAWSTRASVAAAQGLEDIERTALERALALVPHHLLAVERLATHHLAHGRVAEARAVHERALASSPGQEDLALGMARVDLAAGDQVSARTRLEALLRRAPQSREAWELLARQASSLAEASAFAQRLAREQPGNLQVLLAEAQHELLAGQHDLALQATARCLALAPRNLEATDLRMTTLQQLERTEEARALASPERWGGRVPYMLEGRLAMMRASLGDLPGAREDMRTLLQRAPLYVWGWQKVAEWSRVLQDPEAAVEAARQVVRGEPAAAEAYALLGDLLDDLGDLPGACQALTHSLRLQPINPGTAHLLGSIALTLGNLADAEHALELLRVAVQQGPPESRFLADYLEARVASATRQGRRASTAFRALCLEPQAPARALEEARKAMIEGGLGDEAQRVLSKALSRPGAHDRVTSLWRSTERAREAWSLRRLDSMHDDLVAFPRLLDLELQTHVACNDDRRVRSLLRRYEDIIHTTDQVWLVAARALVQTAHPLQSIRFLQAYTRHPEVAPQAALHVAHAYRALGLRTRARRLSHHVCEQNLPANLLYAHHLWLAYDALLAGQLQAAEPHLAALTDVSFQGFFHHLHRVTLALKAFAETPAPQRTYVSHQIDRELKPQDGAFAPALYRRLADRVHHELLAGMAAKLGLFDRAVWFFDLHSSTALLWGVLLLLVGGMAMEGAWLAAWLTLTVPGVALLLWGARRKILEAL